MSSVFPNPAPWGNPAYVIEAWGGAAYDSVGDRLLVWGGGHGDYGGNEIYAFSLATSRWARIWGPSPTIPSTTPNPPQQCIDVLADGSPNSRHTYDGLVFIPSENRFWSAGGSLACGSGGGTSGTWTFDLSSNRWEQRPRAPAGGVTVTSALDSVTGNIYWQSVNGYRFAEYDPVSDAWRRSVDAVLSEGEEMTAEIDPVTRKYVSIGNGRMHVFDLNTLRGSEVSTAGASAVVNARGPGLTYDTALKKIVAWAGGTSVWSLDTSSWTWTEHRVASTNTVMPPATSSKGAFGRFTYIPGRNMYLLVTSATDDVYVYRLSGSTSATNPNTAPATNTAPTSGSINPSAPAPASTTPATNTTTTSGSSSTAAPAPPSSIQARQWTPLTAPSTSQGPYGSPYGGKHSRLLFDSRRNRLVLTGGDYDHPYGGTFNGNQMVWTVNLSTGQWTLLGPWCNPPVMPGRPDNITWVYDSKRDRGVMLPGFYFGSQGATSGCSGVQEVTNAVTFDFGTNKWAQATWPAPQGGYGGDLGATFGVYDPVGDSVYRFRSRGFLERLDIASNTWQSRTVGVTDDDLHADQSAIDVQGRAIYVIARSRRSLLRYDIDRNAPTLIPLPSQWTAPTSEFGGLDIETYLVFDSVNRVILLPHTVSNGGTVLGLGVYQVDRRTWEWLAVPSGVTGNVWGFHAAANVMLGMSNRDRSGKFWLFRYAP